MTSRRIDLIQTLWKLGATNLARVALYRLGLKTGLHSVLRLGALPPEGPFFYSRTSPLPAGAVARRDWREQGLGFGHVPIICADGPPDWHANILGGGRPANDRLWHQLSDFDPVVGDIKGVWEASRLDWLIALAQRAALGDQTELARLNDWLADWARENPPYFGANWKCAQEASIRVLHLALAAIILDQVASPLPGLVELIRIHLARIAPTISYAIAQDNNHGTSEAAALFVGGSWLNRLGVTEAGKWAGTGRRQLAERAIRIISRDGSFSQYSLVYHRLMLDTYAFAECWRRELCLPEFPKSQRERLAAATYWLQQMVDTSHGDGPNLGANDGARLFALEDAEYRDFRPSLQWAAAVFLDRRAIVSTGPWDQRLFWLNLDRDLDLIDDPASAQFDEGGYHVLRQGSAVAYLRYPRFHFRPSQADALHLDFWVGGKNLLRDGGTFSYNASVADLAYFGGTASHNTVMFDGRDQMPRLGRFLFGRWLKASTARQSLQPDQVSACAGYRDHQGAAHHRTIMLTEGQLTVSDRIGGKARQAVLRWRLAPGKWSVTTDGVCNGSFSLRVHNTDVNQPAPALVLVEGQESRWYGSRSPVPVLEVRTTVPANIATTIEY